MLLCDHFDHRRFLFHPNNHLMVPNRPKMEVCKWLASRWDRSNRHHLPLPLLDPNRPPTHVILLPSLPIHHFLPTHHLPSHHLAFPSLLDRNSLVHLRLLHLLHSIQEMRCLQITRSEWSSFFLHPSQVSTYLCHVALFTCVFLMLRAFDHHCHGKQVYLQFSPIHLLHWPSMVLTCFHCHFHGNFSNEYSRLSLHYVQ